MAGNVVDMGDVLVNGLRKDSRQKRNAPWLDALQGLIPTEYGAKALLAPAYSLSTAPTEASLLSWPHAAFLRGADKRQLLLAGRQAIYEIDESDFSAALLDVLDGNDAFLEIVSNGDFSAGSGPPTGWTLGTDWSFSDPNDTCSHASGSAAALTQAAGSFSNAAENGTWYKVTTVVSVLSGGTLTPALSGVSGAAISATGTDVQYIKVVTAGTDFTLTASAACVCTVDSIEVEKMTFVIGAGGIGYDDDFHGGVWHSAFFGENIWFLTCGNTFIYRMPYNPEELPCGLNYKFYGVGGSSSGFAVNTVENHNNRLVLGGLRGGFDTHSEIYEAWRKTSPQDVVTDDLQAIGPSWIYYGMPGGGDNDVPFVRLMACFDTPFDIFADKLEEVIISAVEAGQMGPFPLMHTGEVMVLKVFQGDLIAYGVNGVSRLAWTEQGYRETKLSDLGIPGRGCVNGDEREHVFLTNQGDLCRLTSDGVEVLGYREFLGVLAGVGAPTDGNDEDHWYIADCHVVIAFDPLERYYTISDGTTGYTLTPTGLGGSNDIMPQSMVRSYGVEGLVGTAVEADPVTGVTLVTGIFDNGTRDVWQIETVRLATTDTGAGWSVAIDYRFEKSAAWTRSAAVTCDDRGYARVNVSGIEFRVVCTATNRTLVDLERIEVEPTVGKKMSLRGWLEV